MAQTFCRTTGLLSYKRRTYPIWLELREETGKICTGKMYSKGVYNNADGHLPDATGRIWYEADINYYEGRRNGHRVLWSNDGLIFVTYEGG